MASESTASSRPTLGSVTRARTTPPSEPEDVDRFLGIQPAPKNPNVTCGDWASEDESEAAFNAVINSIGMFNMYEQVRGYYLQPRLGQELKTPRIDRILVPTPDLLQRGWQLGPIGIEIKRSGEKLGEAVAQIQDYSRAAWDMRNGVWIVLQCCFLWPMDRPHGPIASVLSQNRLGSATPGNRYRKTRLVLSTGQSAVAEFYVDGNVRTWPITTGRRAGSR